MSGLGESTAAAPEAIPTLRLARKMFTIDLTPVMPGWLRDRCPRFVTHFPIGAGTIFQDSFSGNADKELK
jgi:hypothetical protein